MCIVRHRMAPRRVRKVEGASQRHALVRSLVSWLPSLSVKFASCSSCLVSHGQNCTNSGTGALRHCVVCVVPEPGSQRVDRASNASTVQKYCTLHCTPRYSGTQVGTSNYSTLLGYYTIHTCVLCSVGGMPSQLGTRISVLVMCVIPLWRYIQKLVSQDNTQLQLVTKYT